MIYLELFLFLPCQHLWVFQASPACQQTAAWEASCCRFSSQALGHPASSWYRAGLEHLGGKWHPCLAVVLWEYLKLCHQSFCPGYPWINNSRCPAHLCHSNSNYSVLLCPYKCLHRNSSHHRTRRDTLGNTTSSTMR